LIRIASGRWAIPLENAKAAVAGYAFATRPVHEQDRAPKWAYKTYDCVPASPGEDFSDLDIFVADGLNAHLDVNAVGALQVAVRRAARDLADAARHQHQLVDLPVEELSDDPPPDSIGWLLTRAYRQMESTRYVGLARAHKVLHHKQPLLVPLLDNVTAGIYQDDKGNRLRADWNLWQHVHKEIGDNSTEFEELREWFASQAAARGGCRSDSPGSTTFSYGCMPPVSGRKPSPTAWLCDWACYSKPASASKARRMVSSTGLPSSSVA
jgi:hypothetical protein